MNSRQTHSRAVRIIYKSSLRNVNWKQMKSTLLEDQFDNGRTPRQLRASFRNSYATVIACHSGRIVGTARVLSDGVCNAYVVDVWTFTPYRRQGIARTMMAMLQEKLCGQHVYLRADDAVEFYKSLGFREQPMGLGKVIGIWLVQEPNASARARRSGGAYVSSLS